MAEEPAAFSLDNTVPNTMEEFEQYGNLLAEKLNLLAKSAEFSLFAEELVKCIALNCKFTLSRKYVTNLEN